MNDVMKYVTSACVAMVVGVSGVGTPTKETTEPPRTTTLVADWGSGVSDSAPLPQSDSTSELNELAKQLAKDADDLRDAAAEQRKIAEGLGSFLPNVRTADAATCQCDCDCVSEERMREVFREELAASPRTTATTASTTEPATTQAPTSYVSVGDQKIINGQTHELRMSNGSPRWMPLRSTVSRWSNAGPLSSCANGQCGPQATRTGPLGLLSW